MHPLSVSISVIQSMLQSIVGRVNASAWRVSNSSIALHIPQLIAMICWTLEDTNESIASDHPRCQVTSGRAAESI